MNQTKQKISSEAQWKSLVYDYLSNGNRGKSNFYELLRTKYKCEKSNTLKQYDIYEAEYDLNLNNGKDAQIQEAEKERLKSAILTKLERMEIASNIAKGKAWKSGNVMIVPNASDRMKACDYLSKIDGDYSPIKQETEVTQTTKLDLSALTDEELRILAEMQRKSGVSET